MTPSAQAHSGDLLLCACANICVTVEGKVVVGRRLHHIELACTGVAHKARAALFWPQWAAAWLLVPHSRTLVPRAADARVRPIFFAPNVTQMYHILTQLAGHGMQREIK